jgi:hypothetical protein
MLPLPSGGNQHEAGSNWSMQLSKTLDRIGAEETLEANSSHWLYQKTTANQETQQ